MAAGRWPVPELRDGGGDVRQAAAFASLLTHPNLTVEMLPSGEDHICAAGSDRAPATRGPEARHPPRSTRSDRAPRRRRRRAAATAASGAAIQHPRVGFPPRVLHAARAANRLLPAGGQHQRSGRQARPHPAPPAKLSRSEIDPAQCPAIVGICGKTDEAGRRSTAVRRVRVDRQ
jgi:hypothetical protein